MKSFELRELVSTDHHLVREIYQDSIESQGSKYYSLEQICAWSSLAWLPGVLDRPLADEWILFLTQVIMLNLLLYFLQFILKDVITLQDQYQNKN